MVKDPSPAPKKQKKLAPVKPAVVAPEAGGAMDPYLAGIMAKAAGKDPVIAAAAAEGSEAPKYEFMAGTDAGSQYLVVAKNKGLKMGVRPFMIPGTVDVDGAKKMVLLIAVRLRVVVADPSGSLLLAKEAFGLKIEPKQKGEHASVMQALPICYLPASLYEAYQQYSGRKLARVLAQRIMAGVKDGMVKTTDLTEYLDAEYSKNMEAAPPAAPAADSLWF